MRTYQFKIDTTSPPLSVIVERISDEYYRFLKFLQRVERPMSKPVYGCDLIMSSLIIRRVSDGYVLELPLGSDVTVPTNDSVKGNTRPLNGSELKAATMAFKRFDPSNGVFFENIPLPRIKHKEMYEDNRTDTPN